MLSFLRTYRRLFGLVARGGQFVVWGQVVLFAVQSVRGLVLAGTEAALVNALIAGEGPRVWLFVAAVIGVMLLWNALETWRGYLEKLLWFRTEERLDMAFSRKMASLDLAVHDDPKRKDLLARVRDQGLWRTITFTAETPFQLLGSAVQFAGAIGAIAYFNPWLALIVLVTTIPEFIVERLAGDEVWSIWSADIETRRRYTVARNGLEQARDLVEVRLFQTKRFFLSIIGTLFGVFQQKQIDVERRRVWRDVAAGAVSNIGIGAALAWFVSEALRGDIQPGTLIFASGSLYALNSAVARLFGQVARFRSQYTFAKDFNDLLALKNEIVSPPGAPKVAQDVAPEIVFDNVSFTYPGADRPSLGNFSLTIPPGQKLAVVGANGAGKTTFVRLLCRFYDPTQGRILVNGKDLREWDLESWYATLGVLFQDFSRYSFDVATAIAMGRNPENPDPIRVEGVARAADAHDFVSKFPERYRQQLGRDFTGGVEPSGGQWQKLAIARALYRDAKVLILDEPTAAVDAESEAKIFEALERLPDTQTAILISHRFSTVRHADQIVVFEEGRATETGSHEELLAANGTYARLFLAQAEGYR